MKRNTSDQIEFELDEKFKDRALELLDETQSLQFAEGLRLGSAMSNVNAREYKRIEQKYGTDHPRTVEMAERVEANEKAKKVLFARYTDTSTPQAAPGEGWAVDGFVRTEDLEPVGGITVAAYDRRGRWYQELGYSCTSEQGYFSIAVEDISDKAPRPIYLRASRGEKLLESNEVRLSPAPKVADRAELIIGKAGAEGDCKPPADGKGEPMPPDPSDQGKEEKKDPEEEVKKEPVPPGKEEADCSETGKDGTKDSSGDEKSEHKEEEIYKKETREEERKKALEEEREKAAEKEREKAAEKEREKTEEDRKKATDEERKKAREQARAKKKKKGFKRYGGRDSKGKNPKKRR